MVAKVQRSVMRAWRKSCHWVNPLHLYCRLMDLGLRREYSEMVCKCYEVVLFQRVSRFVLWVCGRLVHKE